MGIHEIEYQNRCRCPLSSLRNVSRGRIRFGDRLGYPRCRTAGARRVEGKYALRLSVLHDGEVIFGEAAHDRLSLPVNHRYVEEDQVHVTRSAVVGAAVCDLAWRDRPATTQKRNTARTKDRKAGIPMRPATITLWDNGTLCDSLFGSTMVGSPTPHRSFTQWANDVGRPLACDPVLQYEKRCKKYDPNCSPGCRGATPRVLQLHAQSGTARGAAQLCGGRKGAQNQAMQGVTSGLATILPAPTRLPVQGSMESP